MGNELLIQQKKEVLFLGAKGLVKYDGNKILERVEYNVELSLKNGHFCKIQVYSAQANQGQGGYIDKYIMQAEGFEYINKFAGLVQVQEDYFMMNDIKYTNPHITFDAMGKKAKVFAKVTLVGLNNSGNLHFSSSLIIYDTADELVTSLLAKIKKVGDSFGYMTTKDGYDQDVKANNRLVYYPIDDILGIVINLSHKDAVQMYMNYQTQKGHVEKKAMTVAKRNAFRKHPATSVYTLDAQPKKVGDKTVDIVAYVKVTAWQNINNSDLQASIDDYLNGGITVPTDIVNAKDEEPEVMGDGYGASEGDEYAVVETLNAFDDVEQVEQDSEELEKITLINFIKDGAMVVGGPLAKKIAAMNLEEMNITELMTVKNMVNEEATK